jgi:hypothetical protein
MLLSLVQIIELPSLDTPSSKYLVLTILPTYIPLLLYPMSLFTRLFQISSHIPIRIRI